MKEKPLRIAVDFDGTICEQAYPSIGNIKRGARKTLRLFKKLGYEIIIWSCRSCHWDYDIYGGDPSQPVLERPTVVAMKQCLDDNQIPYDTIDDGSKGKPSADFYIDDKGIRFEDNWDEIGEFILKQWVDEIF